MSRLSQTVTRFQVASMKVPPKRKGNDDHEHTDIPESGLNESPSEKEGKLYFHE